MKHLNPRQGITTVPPARHIPSRRHCVKHLNPRQGITTRRGGGDHAPVRHEGCETPKSPPGDYNLITGDSLFALIQSLSCETPKSPPGDYNSAIGALGSRVVHTRLCETPKSPPGDYNATRLAETLLYTVNGRVKHLNPRQGITTPLPSTRRERRLQPRV